MKSVGLNPYPLRISNEPYNFMGTSNNSSTGGTTIRKLNNPTDFIVIDYINKLLKTKPPMLQNKSRWKLLQKKLWDIHKKQVKRASKIRKKYKKNLVKAEKEVNAVDKRWENESKKNYIKQDHNKLTRYLTEHDRLMRIRYRINTKLSGIPDNFKLSS